MAKSNNNELPSPIILRKSLKNYYDNNIIYAKHHINPACRAAIAILRSYKKNNNGELRVIRAERLAMRIDSELIKIENNKDSKAINEKSNKNNNKNNNNKSKRFRTDINRWPYRLFQKLIDYNPLTEIDNDDSLSLLKVTPQLMHFDSFQIGCLNLPPHTGHSEEVPSGFTYNVLFLDL